MINSNYDKLRICIFVATYQLMYKIFFTLISFFLLVGASAQKNISVKGSAKTEDGKPLTQASVSLYYVGTKDTLKIITNDKGAYLFNNVLAKKVLISISFNLFLTQIYKLYAMFRGVLLCFANDH